MIARKWNCAAGACQKIKKWKWIRVCDTGVAALNVCVKDGGNDRHLLRPWADHYQHRLVREVEDIDEREDLSDPVNKRPAQFTHDFQSDSNIRLLYDSLKDRPKVRWKKSLRQVLAI
jgi:hypothetical protein